MKKVASVLLSTLMAASLAACGQSTSAGTPAATAAPAATEAPAATAAAEPTAAPASEEGKVLNIYCWNEEFKSRLEDHYPGYEKVDATTGKIGDVTVKFTITPSTDNAYQNKLDEALPANASAAADDKVDIFLVEADYALKYTGANPAVALDVKADLGLTDADLANQYQYTKDVVTADGVLRGVSWQGCPGVLIYNRAAAKEVFGDDAPETVQEKVKDWAAFNAAAKELNAKGYTITSTVNDAYRVYSNNVTSKWVEDGKINIDPNIMKWVEDSKALVDAGYTTTAELWSDDWNKGFYPEGKVFCYFGPAWLINFSMKSDDAASIAAQGGWGATEGPQGFNWGGTWICGAQGSDNPTLVADIMKQLTCTESIMSDIVKKDSDFVNNKPAMEAAAKDDSYAFPVLGGQNPLAMFCAGAEKISMANISIYDQGCTEEFQKAMKNYFDGNATLDESLDLFYKGVEEKYPELTH
ncbi:MAG: hypothetical protein IKD66_04720 [Solobacterium sp.]|nr:hypothetical protein [Solobacterium sp.]